MSQPPPPIVHWFGSCVAVPRNLNRLHQRAENSDQVTCPTCMAFLADDTEKILNPSAFGADCPTCALKPWCHFCPACKRDRPGVS